jgi:transposase
MQKLRQVLLLLKRGYSEREIVKQTQVSRPTVHSYSILFTATGLSYDQLLRLKDHELNELLKAGKPVKTEPVDARRAHFDQQLDYFLPELKRVGVTRFLLWQEYLALYPSGFQYSRFCELLDLATASRKAAMHFDHQPAELLEVDFAGAKLHYIDAHTGEVIECPVLIGVLPFSGYSFVQALANATLPQVIKGLNNMLNYFQGVPLNVISDNMKQWVSRTCRYEPTFPELLGQWALHNQIGLLATRPACPTDKASVENQVLITYRRIYALLRHDTFYSLQELNQAIVAKLEAHHDQNFQKKAYSRSALFLAQEKPHLQPLPDTAFQLRHTTRAKVQKNYHVVLGEDWHFYSVPFTYLGKEVSMVYCSDQVEIYHELQRIAIHRRSYKKHGYTTLLEHMPERHRKIAESRGWNPEYYLQQAAENGPATRQFFTKIMEAKITIHQAYGPCQAILRFIAVYGPERVEAACRRALKGNKYNYGIIKTILENKMDLLEDQPKTASPIPVHENLRGAQAFQNINLN